MAGTYIPAVPGQYFDDDGTVAAGALLFTYLAGTTTKATTYSNSSLATANTNPIVLDAAGRATIFLAARTSWKFVLAPPTDTDPPTSAIWTRDNIAAIPEPTEISDVAGTAGENLAAGDAVYLSQGDGSRTAGRWYKTDADLDYASVNARNVGFATQAISAASSGLIRVNGRVTGLSGLVAGTSYYISATAGDVTSTAPENARFVGVADSGTSLVLSLWPEFDANTDVHGTAGEAIAADEVVYLSDGSGGQTAGRWYLADADNTYSSTQAEAIGVAPSAISSGSIGVIRQRGIVPHGSVTAGAVYYISATAGGLTTTAPANARIVGVGDVGNDLVLVDYPIQITGPASSGTNNGPAVSLTGGLSGTGATGNGGAASVTGGASAATNGAGGAAGLTGGAGAGSGNGGAVTVTGGAAGSTGAGGAVTVTGGIATAGAGGGMTVSAGDGAGTGNGGAAAFQGGDSGAGATGNGGNATLNAGNAASTNGSGGDVGITGGDAKGTGTGGDINLLSGESEGASGTAGDILIRTGDANGGTEGSLTIQKSDGLLGFYGTAAVDQPDHVADPAGGGTVDSEARTAIAAVIDRLKELGLIAPDP